MKFLNRFVTLSRVTDTENFKPFYFGHHKEERNKRNKKSTGGIMAKTVTKLDDCTPSVTSVTKRNKRNKLDLDSKRNSVTTPPFRGVVRYACPGFVQKPFEGLFDVLAIVTAAERLARDFQILRAEVVAYLDGYTSRGIRSEGLALAKLGKAAER